MKENKLLQFIAFLTTSDFSFRVYVFYYPLFLATLSFPLWWLRRRDVSESLLFSASMFLLACFVGLMYQALRRRNVR
jgi:hypothetical protein